MAKWVTEQLEALLVQLNEVPYTDDRDNKQLTILMNGFMRINNQAMDKAASKSKQQIENISVEDFSEESLALNEDASADELTRLRPIK